MNENKCPACGAALEQNATECKYCGEPIAVNGKQYQAPNVQYQASSYSGKRYYEEEFQKISDSNETYRGKWNWCAFFFSWIWAFTKGLWGLALVNLGIGFLLALMDITWVGLVISILWGLRGNYCYYNLQVNNKQFPNKF